MSTTGNILLACPGMHKYLQTQRLYSLQYERKRVMKLKGHEIVMKIGGGVIFGNAFYSF